MTFPEQIWKNSRKSLQEIWKDVKIIPKDLFGVFVQTKREEAWRGAPKNIANPNTVKTSGGITGRVCTPLNLKFLLVAAIFDSWI